MKKAILTGALVGLLLALASDALLLTHFAHQIPFILNPYAFIGIALYGLDLRDVIIGVAVIYLANMVTYSIIGALVHIARKGRLAAVVCTIPIVLYYAYILHLFYY